MRPWEAVHGEVHASQTEPKLCGLHAPSRHGLPRCFVPRSRRHSPRAHKKRTRARVALATVRCDVLADVTGRRRVRSFDLLDPAGCLLLQPGHQQTPTGLEDAPVETGLGCDVLYQSLRRSPPVPPRKWRSPPGQLPQGCLVEVTAAGLGRPDQPGRDAQPVLVPVVLRRILWWPAAQPRSGLHR